MEGTSQFVIRIVLLIAFMGILSLLVSPADPASFYLIWILTSAIGIVGLRFFHYRKS